MKIYSLISSSVRVLLKPSNLGAEFNEYRLQIKCRKMFLFIKTGYKWKTISYTYVSIHDSYEDACRYLLNSVGLIKPFGNKKYTIDYE